MTLLLVVCLGASFVELHAIGKNANMHNRLNIRGLSCKGELSNPIVNNEVRRRRQLNVCYCDSELFQNDPTGCQIVCGNDGVNKGSTRLTECSCVENLETCRKWMCRLGNEGKSDLYCLTVNQSLVPCGYSGRWSLTDFDQCQCGNGGWRNGDGFCDCPRNFFGPTCESVADDTAKRRGRRLFFNEKYRRWFSWFMDDIGHGGNIHGAYLDEEQRSSNGWSGFNRIRSGRSVPTSTLMYSELTDNSESWYNKSYYTVLLVVVGGVILFLIMLAVAYICCGACGGLCSTEQTSRRITLVVNRTPPPELAGVRTLYLQDSSEPLTMGQSSAQGSSNLRIVVSTRPPPPPPDEALSEDESPVDTPTVDRRAAPPSAPPASQGEEEPPSYHEVVRSNVPRRII